MTRQAVTTKRSGSRIRAVGEVIGELKKVVWLSRREAAYLTLVVLVVAIVVGMILGAIDLGFTRFMDRFFLGG